MYILCISLTVTVGSVPVVSVLHVSTALYLMGRGGVGG